MSDKHVETVVELLNVSKGFTRGSQEIPVLTNTTLHIPKGDFVAVMGPSGSGKSTLLNLCAGLDRPTTGKVIVNGQDLGDLSEAKLSQWRSENLGFIFQMFNLMPVLSAQENVELPLMLTPLSRAERRKQAETSLRIVGLADRADHYPRQLSGGQEQRVAIARALANDPVLLLADEPTGNLDSTSAQEVLDLLDSLNEQFGTTIVMVTHDPKAARRAKRMLHLEKGTFVQTDIDELERSVQGNSR
jgi:putative ABC transport system ATP-binding protein